MSLPRIILRAAVIGTVPGWSCGAECAAVSTRAAKVDGALKPQDERVHDEVER